jgi:hypothetical protein
MRVSSSGIDFDAVVQVLSFSLVGSPGASEWVAKNPTVEMTLAGALCLVCSPEWAGAGNVLGKIVRPDGPPILTMRAARDLLEAPDFPQAQVDISRKGTHRN